MTAPGRMPGAIPNPHMEMHTETSQFPELMRLVRDSLNQTNHSTSVEVTGPGKAVLHGLRVHLDADVFSFAVCHRDDVDHLVPLNVVEHARLLSLLCAARQHMAEDHCGHFSHWVVGRHSSAGVPVLYRFAVYESSRHSGDWLITQSSV